jgi:methylthioribose-1-phosphate isomerase
MKVDGKPYRTIWLNNDGVSVSVIDQTLLPHQFKIVEWHTVEDVAQGIRSMVVRGAPLIGASAGYGVALEMLRDPSDNGFQRAYELLFASRPTAVNLRWALDTMRDALLKLNPDARAPAAFTVAAKICDEDVANCSAIGEYGLSLIEQAWDKTERSRPVNLLTHCNAGWLATVDWGTALAPIYKAFDAGIPVHVWVDETRPRNQGAALTAWELGHHGVPHTVIVDNAGGYLMQRGQVDLCIVGSDRTTATGDVCNKIGTYLKALAARENQIPFYVALPLSTIDWKIDDGIKSIPIETRSPEEVTNISGRTKEGLVCEVQLTPDGSAALNYAFDVTPRYLVTALITEYGVFRTFPEDMARLRYHCSRAEPSISPIGPIQAQKQTGNVCF